MLTPRQTVEALDKYIIGQDKAKRSVAIALRNRYRRSKLPVEIRDEISPKNIIMVGPTGVGKTEIARRLAKLVDAPFIKIEATKFTEVGYVGRDVDSMIRDLVEVSVRMTHDKKANEIRKFAESAAELRLADLVVERKTGKRLPDKLKMPDNPLQALVTGILKDLKRGDEEEETFEPDPERDEWQDLRVKTLKDLREGKLENLLVDMVMEKGYQGGKDTFITMGIDINMGDMFGDILPKQKKNKRMRVKDARRILVQEEIEKCIDMDEVVRVAIERAEQNGIIFIDEIDKIASKRTANGIDVSREGVQRDILPIIEGSTVSTKYGPVHTDFMLFIAAGAFHIASISDLIPELQGRFPIHVSLDALTKDDFKRILTQPENAVIKQYKALLATEKVNLIFMDDAIDRIAEIAFEFNENNENIGARRLYAIMENLLDEILFEAGGKDAPKELTIDREYVESHISSDKTVDLHRYIL